MSTVTIEVVLVHETKDALLVEFEGEEFWVPKKIATYAPPAAVLDYAFDLTTPEWFAYKKGII